MPRHRQLIRQLSDAGIAPRYLVRLDTELADHFADIEREARAVDRSAFEAAVEARMRLGSDAAIAAEFLARPELKLWVYRWPFALYCLGSIVWLLVTLLWPLQLLHARRASLARYGTALTIAAVLLCGMLFCMQLVLHADRPSLTATAFTLERFEASPTDMRRVPDEVTDELQTPLPRARTLSPAPIELEPALPLLADNVPPTAEDLVLELLDGEYLPIVKVAPIYPSRALSRGLEGYVVVQFTVARTGAVKDVVVVESTDELFEQAAVEAVYKFKYRPRIIGGESVEVAGVRNKITFDIAA